MPKPRQGYGYKKGRSDVGVTWGEVSRFTWPEVVRLAAGKCKEIGALLLVVDTIGQFTGLKGDAENNAGDALRAMEPLQQASAGGLGILVSQHERKAGGDVEDSGRGSSAFAGAADIVLNIRRLPGNCSPNLRAIRALSRFDDIPNELMVELISSGYVIRDTRMIASQKAELSILDVISKSTELDAMALDDLCETAGVKRTIGQDALNKLVNQERVFRTGKGRKRDPYRYYAAKIHSAGTAACREKKGNDRPEDEVRSGEQWLA